MKKDVKKILASLGVAGLISAGGVTLPGHAAGSGWGAKPSAGSADTNKSAGSSGWSGHKSDAVSAGQEEAKKAGEAAEDTKKSMEETKKQVEEELPKKKAAKSGWGGWL